MRNHIRDFFCDVITRACHSLNMIWKMTRSVMLEIFVKEAPE